MTTPAAGPALTDAECERMARAAWYAAKGEDSVLPGFTLVALMRATWDGFAAGLARARGVPREPTQKMLDAPINDREWWPHCTRRAIWRAMYDAAPAPAAAPATLPCISGCGRASMMPDSEYCAECAADTNATAPVPHSDEPAPAPGAEDGLVRRLRDTNARHGPQAANVAMEQAADRIERDVARIAELLAALAAHRKENAILARERDETRKRIRVYDSGGFADADALAAHVITLTDRAERLAAALREIDTTSKGFPYAGVTCGHIARAALAGEDGHGQA